MAQNLLKNGGFEADWGEGRLGGGEKPSVSGFP